MVKRIKFSYSSKMTKIIVPSPPLMHIKYIQNQKNKSFYRKLKIFKQQKFKPLTRMILPVTISVIQDNRNCLSSPSASNALLRNSISANNFWNKKDNSNSYCQSRNLRSHAHSKTSKTNYGPKLTKNKRKHNVSQMKSSPYSMNLISWQKLWTT